MKDFETIKTRVDSGVLFATFNAPPMNLIGIAMTRDIVDLCSELEDANDISVVVFNSADKEFFLPHIDVTEDYPKETFRIGGPANGSLGGVFRRLDTWPTRALLCFQSRAPNDVSNTGNVRGGLRRHDGPGIRCDMAC